MANVLFKQGTQSALNEIRSNKTAIEGSFYLTNDTHRLYIGRANGDAVPVNEGVNTVTSLSDLPRVTAGNESAYVGQFYYVTAQNILCVYSASSQTGNEHGWVQINPNTNTHLKDLKINITVTDGVATVSTSITETMPTSEDAGDSIVKDFKVQGNNGITVGVTDNSVDGTGDILTISGDQYSLSAGTENSVLKTVDLSLSSNSGHDSSVTLKSGGNITVSKDGDDILISGDDTQLNTAVGANEAEGFSVTVSDTKGNSEKATINPQIKVGADAATQQTVKFQNGLATLPVYTKDELDKKLIGLDAMTYKGTVGNSRTLVDVSNAGVRIGDTLLLDADILSIPAEDGNKQAKTGDMIIARGTEDPTTGLITSGLVWDIVPSGNDRYTDTTYIGKPTEGEGASGDGIFASKPYQGIKIQDTIENEACAELDIYAGDNITIDGDSFVSGSNIIGNKVLISHSNVATEGGTAAPATKEQKTGGGTNFDQAAGESLSFTAVTSVTRDTKGHVIGVKTKDITVVDTFTNINKNDYESSVVTSNNTSTATVTNTIVGKNPVNSDIVTTKTGSFAIESSTLQLTNTNTGTGTEDKSTVIVADIVWGTF